MTKQILETLIVDDDKTIHMILNAFFLVMNIPHKSFLDPSQALEYVSKRNQEGVKIGMGLLDYEMPVLKGDRLAEELRKIDCEVPLVLITGYSNITEDDVLNLFNKVIYKPFGISDIKNIVSDYHRNSNALKDMISF